MDQKTGSARVKGKCLPSQGVNLHGDLHDSGLKGDVENVVEQVGSKLKIKESPKHDTKPVPTDTESVKLPFSKGDEPGTPL